MMNIKNTWSRLTGVASSLLMVLAIQSGVVSVAAAQTATLQDVSFASLPGGRFEVQMQFDAPPQEPADYVIDKPARIVFDFGAVKNGLSTKKFPLPFENAQSAVVLGGKDKTRLILNMTSLDVYKTRIDGNKLLIEVGGNKIQEVALRSNTFQEKTSSEITQFDASITNIDFRRGENGEGKVLIDLSDSSVNVNVDQTAKEIKLSFLDTKLPVDLRRKLDVVDFATPVLAVSASFDGQNTQITVKPKGDYDYLAYQADNLYVVSVKELSEAEKEEKRQKFAFIGEKLSLNFQDIPVRSVLQIIADFTELNLVASDTVEGNITLRLDNVPWDQALELVLRTKSLDKRQVGNVLMVAPADEIAEAERRQLETQKQLEELAPLRTEFIRILYADANELFKLFDSKGSSDEATQSILSERGSAIVDERTNSIVITETQQKIEAFRDLIAKLDIPVRQVEIEARVVRATDTAAKALGVRWGVDGGYDDFIIDSDHKAVITSGSLFGGAVAVRDPDVDIKYDDDGGGVSNQTNNAVGLGVPGATGQFMIGYATRNNFIGMELSALEGVGTGEVVSQPKVITQDKKEALIKSGTKIPYQTTSDSGTRTEFVDAVLGLTVTPYITPNDRVLMAVNITKDSVGALIGESEVLPIDITNIKTEIMVDNGQTAVIGGIFEEATSQSVDKVPFLGDLPVLGRLFRRTSQSSQKVELLIFLTPRIINDPLARE